MNLEQLKAALSNQSDTIQFESVLGLIDSLYSYTPTAFSNGLGDEKFTNAAGTNEGSCRVFAFAKAQGFSKEETLHCFAQYYRDDVLQNPEGSDHANIRTFMRFGWDGIAFDGVALTPKII